MWSDEISIYLGGYAYAFVLGLAVLQVQGWIFCSLLFFFTVGHCIITWQINVPILFGLFFIMRQPAGDATQYVGNCSISCCQRETVNIVIANKNT